MKLRFADLFCGAGGTTTGAESTGEAECVFAVNHWDRAISTHSLNHPHARHAQRRVQDVRPTESPPIGCLFASPECTHHSRARGGLPTSDQQRAGAWEILPWVECHRPSFLVVENVPEFREWGPVGKDGKPLKSQKGKLFESWIAAVKSYGYRVECGVLNAADFGAATSRSRLFVIARKGNRAAPFPEPTHGKNVARSLPGMERLPWKPAFEIIDWSLPCPTIFTRSRPLADKTLSRIEAGLRRFVGPFVAQWDNTGFNGKCVRDVADPLPTLVTKANAGIAVPFQYQLIGTGFGRSKSVGEPVNSIVAARGIHGVAVPYLVPNFGERFGQAPRTHSLSDPTPTVTGHGAGGLAVPYLTTVNHGDAGHKNGRSESLRSPIGTVTNKNGRAVVVPFLTQHYGSGGQWSAIDAPVPTIVTKDRHSLVTATIEPCCLNWPEPQSDAMRSLQATMRELGVADIGFRMLSNPELSAAQGFPADYQFTGTKAEITKQIGNSVSPTVARAITLSLLGL